MPKPVAQTTNRLQLRALDDTDLAHTAGAGVAGKRHVGIRELGIRATRASN